MASLSKVDGALRIYFKSSNGSRQIIYCGRMTKKQADAALRCINDLERCRIDGSVPQPSTSMWLAEVGKELHAKLAKHGLTTARVVTEAPTVEVITLEDLIERYKTRPKWLATKESTRTMYHYSFVPLMECLGADRDIATIYETDGEDLVATLAAKYAEATTARIARAGITLMRYAVRARLLPANPFEGIRPGSFVTPHKVYVDAETCVKVMKACPDLETRLVVALARFAGLRTPSEPLVLRWKDIDWAGRRFHCDSPKTGPRTIPIVAEVMPLLEQQFEAVPEGTEFVLPKMVAGERTAYYGRVVRLVERMDIEKWPRFFHSMRASRQTDWNEVFPAHVTAAWMGNSPTIGDKHYNRTLDAHFEAATNPTHNPTQTMPENARMERNEK